MWRIEPLTRADQIDDVLAIEEASFTNPWTREMYLAEMDNRGVSYCFLAHDDAGRVVGFCSFWRVLDELHINNLAVKPESRRTGVATALLAHVLREGAAWARSVQPSRCAAPTIRRGSYTNGSGSPSPA